jgi:hypothetical protein
MQFSKVGSRLSMHRVYGQDKLLSHSSGKGARVALLVTEGYRDILQIRRCQVPGGLAGEYVPQYRYFQCSLHHWNTL